MKKVVVCVDDEAIVLDSLKRQLENHLSGDYLIEVAENAQEALELVNDLIAEGSTVLLVISDWLMPGMKGDEFLIELHKNHPEINKILLSGQADDHAIARLYSQTNLHGFLQKPWSSEVLLGSVDAALRDFGSSQLKKQDVSL